jgi:hypothetical protein
VPFLGERPQRLREEGERLHGDGQLAGPRPEHVAGDPDEIPDVERGEERILVAELIGAGVELDPTRHVHQVREARLAVMPHRDDATRHADRAHRLQFVVTDAGGALAQRPRPVGHGIAAAERVDPARAQRLQFRPTLPDQLVVVAGRRHDWPARMPCSSDALMNASMSPSMTASTLPISSPVRWSFTS